MKSIARQSGHHYSALRPNVECPLGGEASEGFADGHLARTNRFRQKLHGKRLAWLKPSGHDLAFNACVYLIVNGRTFNAIETQRLSLLSDIFLSRQDLQFGEFGFLRLGTVLDSFC